MKKKVLVLGAVSCVAGIVSASAAGCSSETTITEPAPDSGGGGQDATKEARPPVEAAPEEDAGQCPVDPGFDAAKMDAEYGYKNGKATPGKCTTEDLVKFDKNLDTAKKWVELTTDLSADCTACIVTTPEADTWGPVIIDDQGRGFFNFGACFGVVDKESCGKAIQYLEVCIDAACGECATTETESKKCAPAAAQGVCGDFLKTYQSQCKDDPAIEKKCNNIVDAARTLCGPPTGDGGADAGDAADQ